MIATLVARTDFAPVPRVEFRLDPLDVADGGSSSASGTGLISGGTPAGTGDEMDGGSASLVAVDVPAGTETVTLWRLDADRDRKIQGAVNRPLGSTVSILDYAAPPNASCSYEIEFENAAGPIGRAAVGTTFLPWNAPSEYVLIQNPLNPNLNALVKNMSGSWPSIQRSVPGVDIATEGEDLPIFVGAGPLSGIQDLAVDFLAETRETAGKVWATLGTRQNPQIKVWLIRSPNPGVLPAVFYGRVSAPQEIDETVSEATATRVSRFRATLTETRQPAPALLAPSLRYSDLAAALGGTYTSIARALPRYSQWASAWEYAGAAG